MSGTKKRKFPVILILALFLAAGAWIFYQEKFNPVEVIPVSMLRDDWWKEYDMCAGEVTNSMSQEVFSYNGKKIDDLYVEIGQEVKAGDPLLSFDMEEEKIDLEMKEYAVKEAERSISYAAQEEKAELEREWKQLKLEYDTLKKEVEDATIYASIDGIVKSIHGEAVETGGAVLVVTSERKLYVKGLIDEFSYASVKTGSMLTAVSWDTGKTFQARITEISSFPASKDEYKLEAGKNPNVSYYPFSAVIVDTMVDVQAGERVNIGFDGISQKLFLPLAYLQSEGGESYIYIRNEKGRLEKRYVTTGQSLYNTVIEIKEGLTSEDYIAFPYGKNIREGANTVISKDAAEIIY